MVLVLVGWLVRFIPAGAGNSGAASAALSRRPVHPRGGGELGVVIPQKFTLDGSSPRGRGTQVPGKLRIMLARFIPAGAGNSSARRGGGC